VIAPNRSDTCFKTKGRSSPVGGADLESLPRPHESGGEGWGEGAMTFKTKLFSNKIVSDEGFSVRTVGRGAILYEKGDQCVYVSAEPLMTKGVSWVIYPTDMSLESEWTETHG